MSQARSSQKENRRHDTWASVEEMAARPMEVIEEYPMSSALAAFGIGIGIGMLLGQTLAGSSHRREEASASMIQSLGCQIADAVRSALPESISRHFA